MRTRRWAVAALATLALGAVLPTAGSAAAAPGRDRSAGGDVTAAADNRVPVTPTTTFPASATVLLTYPGGQCTGFMISARTVATAGHCLHTGGSRGFWRSNVVAYPGHDGTSAPFGSCRAVRLFVSPGWLGSPAHGFPGDPTQDYGAAQLDCTIGNTTGWYGLGYTTQSLAGSCTAT
ncbi:trypsin-like serine peptidase [Micromonospora sp. SH-82]|uniref:trypsin-like serine peptidase n=1 Tax=Micromonospora sp. SH-82 TaxID=3132938 RepID=UPI003EBC39AC